MKFQKQFFKKYFLFPQACFISSSFIPSFLPYPLIIWSLTFFSHPSRISCLMSIFCLLPAFSMIQPPIENAFHSLCPLFPWACLLLICHLLTFVVVISCNSVPVISDSCFTSDCVTSRPPAFHSHLLSVVIAFSTLVYCLCSSLIYHVFHLALILSHFQIYVALFLNFLVIVHLFCELFFFFFHFPVPGWQELLDGFVFSICIEHRSLLCISWVARMNQLLLTFLRTLSSLCFLLPRIRLIFQKINITLKSQDRYMILSFNSLFKNL